MSIATSRFLLLTLTAALLPALGLDLVPYLQADSLQFPASASHLNSQFAENKREVLTPGAARWRISLRGVERLMNSSDPWEARRLFHSRRFLPCDEVLALAPEAPSTPSTPGSGEGVWVKTTCGFSHIRFRPMTLSQKAAYFEKRIADRHYRHALVADSRLRNPGDLSSNQLFSNDNDGLWTAIYAAAKLFEYRATQSRPALDQAQKSIAAILRLEKLTGIPGYPARSWRSPEEEKPKDGVWYWTPDRQIEWKSDTSSDEIVGHFLIFDLAWELLPKSALRDDVRATCRRMIDHILANDLNLIDKSGKPTTWGQWSTAYFASTKGRPDSPLNALEILSFLKVAERVTGDPKYAAHFRHIAFDLGYLEIMTQYLERMEELNYSDEELALLSFYPWMRKERDPKLRTALEKAFAGWWKNISREKNPLWNTIREVLLQPDPQLRQDSLATLRRIPMDLIAWRVENSWRTDLPRVPQLDRHGRPETTTLLAPDERAVMKWNGNPFVLEGGNGGRTEDDGAFFLLPYWMGRYYKLWVER